LPATSKFNADISVSGDFCADFIIFLIIEKEKAITQINFRESSPLFSEVFFEKQAPRDV
jgi:hypothetical protein